MLGVRRAVNPALQLAGDGVGRSDLSALQALCAGNPDVRFLVTVLSRENQHELCVLARKFRNLHVFGCWWFTNVPSIIEEMTRARMELLGFDLHAPALRCPGSGSGDLQVGAQSRGDRPGPGGQVHESAAAGWEPSEAAIRRDVAELFGGAFDRFCAGPA